MPLRIKIYDGIGLVTGTTAVISISCSVQCTELFRFQLLVLNYIFTAIVHMDMGGQPFVIVISAIRAIAMDVEL